MPVVVPRSYACRNPVAPLSWSFAHAETQSQTGVTGKKHVMWMWCDTFCANFICRHLLETGAEKAYSLFAVTWSRWSAKVRWRGRKWRTPAGIRRDWREVNTLKPQMDLQVAGMIRTFPDTLDLIPTPPTFRPICLWSVLCSREMTAAPGVEAIDITNELFLLASYYTASQMKRRTGVLRLLTIPCGCMNDVGSKA